MTPPDLKIVESGSVHKRRQPFGMVFEALLHDLNISDGAIRLYAHMHWRYGSNRQLYERIGTMADAMGVTDRVIKNRTAELAAAGWIVAIARRTPEGKVTSNFYHVFESPRDAKEFRKSYQAADGEHLLAAPTVEPRKSRKGVGGAKTHKNKDKGTQVPLEAAGTQVPTEGGTQVPAIQKQVIETQEHSSSKKKNGDAPKRAKKTEQPADPYAKQKDELIHAWLTGIKSIDSSAYGNKTTRKQAQSMIDASITPELLTEFLTELMREPFWRKNPPTFGAVLQRIGLWLDSRQPHIVETDPAPVHTPSTIAPDTKVDGDLTAAEFDALTDDERQAIIERKLASIADRITGTEGGKRGRQTDRNELDALNKSA